MDLKDYFNNNRKNIVINHQLEKDLLKRKYNHKQIRIICKILYFQLKNNYFYEKVDFLAEELNLSKRSVLRYLKELIDNGLIVKEKMNLKLKYDKDIKEYITYRGTEMIFNNNNIRFIKKRERKINNIIENQAKINIKNDELNETIKKQQEMIDNLKNQILDLQSKLTNNTMNNLINNTTTINNNNNDTNNNLEKEKELKETIYNNSDVIINEKELEEKKKNEEEEYKKELQKQKEFWDHFDMDEYRRKKKQEIMLKYGAKTDEEYLYLQVHGHLPTRSYQGDSVVENLSNLYKSRSIEAHGYDWKTKLQTQEYKKQQEEEYYNNLENEINENFNPETDLAF